MVAYSGGFGAYSDMVPLSLLKIGVALIAAQGITEVSAVNSDPFAAAEYNISLQGSNGVNMGAFVDAISDLATIAMPTSPEPQAVILEQIPTVGPPLLKTELVQINPSLTTYFTAMVPPPQQTTSPPAPTISQVSLIFSSGGTPQVVLTGNYSHADGSPAALNDLSANFTMPGGQVVTLMPDPATSTQSELRFNVPTSLIVGLAQITVVRQDKVRQFPPGPNPFVYVYVPAVSSSAQLEPSGNYIFVALPEAPNGKGGQGEIGVIDGSPDSSTFNQVIADIPVGTKFPTAAPREVVVTSDNTRVYATLRGGSSVAVIDALALQEVTDIALPAGSLPYGLAIDEVHQLLYVADQVVHTWTIGSDGAIHGVSSLYVIDIDPASKKFDTLVNTISLKYGTDLTVIADSTGLIAPTGLRNVAVSPDGLHVYVTAPNVNADPKGQNFDVLEGNVIRIDMTEPAIAGQPLLTQSINAIGASEATYGLGLSPDDPTLVAFTNAETDDFGFETSTLTGNPRVNIPLNLDPLEVHDAGGIAFIKAVDGTQYAFVAGRADVVPSASGGGTDDFGNLIGGSVSDFLDQTANPLYEDGNVGIIRDPFGTSGELVAATRPIAYGFPVDLMLTPPEGASGDQYLYVSFQGLPLTSGGGGVMVYDATKMIAAVENPANAPYLSRVGIDDLPLNSTNQRNPNTAIDVQADYHLDYTNPSAFVYTITNPARAPIATGGFPGGIAMMHGDVPDVEVLAPAYANQPAPVPTVKNVVITTTVDAIAGTVTSSGGAFTFSIDEAAQVTLLIAGAPAEDLPGHELYNLNTGHTYSLPTSEEFKNVQLDAGTYTTDLSNVPAVALPGSYPFTLTAVNAAGASSSKDGTIDHEIEENETYPVAHTIIKGVDIWDGHLTMSSQDINVPGRGLDLQFTRTYSSAGNSSLGVVGAGWSDNYNATLVDDGLGHYTIIGGDGSGNTFGVAGTQNAAKALLYGVPANALFFDPQVGYHSTLARYQDPVDPTKVDFDFFSTADIRYHFQIQADQPPTMLQLTTVYSLRYIEDPNGNKISLYYSFNDPGASAFPAADFDNDPTTLDVVADSSGRALIFRYDFIYGQKRIVEMTGFDPDPTDAGDLLGLDIQYNYDELPPGSAADAPPPAKIGNLTSVVHIDRGTGAVLSKEAYTYTTGEGLDGHNLLSYLEPNAFAADGSLGPDYQLHTTTYSYMTATTPAGTSIGVNVLFGTTSVSPNYIGFLKASPVEVVRQIQEPGGVTGVTSYSLTKFTYNFSVDPNVPNTRLVTDRATPAGPRSRRPPTFSTTMERTPGSKPPMKTGSRIRRSPL